MDEMHHCRIHLSITGNAVLKRLAVMQADLQQAPGASLHVSTYVIAAGGAYGYEGGCLFLIEGSKENIKKVQAFAKENAGLNASPVLR